MRLDACSRLLQTGYDSIEAALVNQSRRSSVHHPTDGVRDSVYRWFVELAWDYAPLMICCGPIEKVRQLHDAILPIANANLKVLGTTKMVNGTEWQELAT